MKETEKAVVKRRKRYSSSKMTVQAYYCTCGSILECSIECAGNGAAYAASAIKNANGTAAAVM